MKINTIKKLASAILKKHGIVRAAVFGSATRNEDEMRSELRK